MRNLLKRYGGFARQIIVFFYPLFRKVVSEQVFVYGVTGVMNILFDWSIYFFTYNFLLRKENFDFGLFTMSPHMAALTFTFPVSFTSGFLLQKYVTFTASSLHGKTQIVRYLLVVWMNFMLNFLGLKLFVDVLHFFPTPSKMIITGFTVIVSYLFQKKFTFKV